MKLKTILMSALFLLCIVGFAQASLTTIGTANYDGTNYNLIYDNDDNGHDGGGLVWLDYTNSTDTWQNQKDWASGLGSSLTVTLNPGYTTSIDWETGWRLPDTVDGYKKHGYKGDPDGDGIYIYTSGYNLANSEMGHLFYTELGNTGYQNTDGSYNLWPPDPPHLLQNTGDFDNLIAAWYWSGTEYTYDSYYYAWFFNMGNGAQSTYSKGNSNNLYGIAVHSGHVSTTVPIPCTIILFGSGLLSLVRVSRRKFKNQR